MHFVQLIHPVQGRKIALVNEPDLVLINSFDSIYELAYKSITSGKSITDWVNKKLSGKHIPYDEVYHGKSVWKLLPAFDHPEGPFNLLLSGTGLTHKASAENRQKMNEAEQNSELTDSMKMYLWGVEGGQPEPGKVGVQPEWFYKGNGSMLRAHGQTLDIPAFGNDGGEEPEIAGIYINDENGTPFRIGFATANEFSDHVMERKNYLYLAPSKIRTCSIGPELVIGQDFQDISGKVSVQREGKTIWEKGVKTGEKNMAHSLANLEYHHFKYENHRLPGQGHVHFFGTGAFSFGDGIELADGDMMEVDWEGMGRALRNVLRKDSSDEKMFEIRPLK